MEELLELLVLSRVAICGVSWCGSHAGRVRLNGEFSRYGAVIAIDTMPGRNACLVRRVRRGKKAQ
jgi:hypothetical protein